VFDCQASGTVTGQSLTGGLIGYAFYNTISRCGALVDVWGRYKAGGFVGSAAGSTITLSCCRGAVTGDEEIGGFAGRAGTIRDCYCRSDVTGADIVGGLAGGGGPIIRCYAASSVTRIASTAPVTFLGGFAGYASQADSKCEGDCPVAVSACFWDADLPALTEAFGNRPADPGTAAGLPTTEMQTAAPFRAAGWDFSNTWTICEGQDYPRLGWEEVACDE